MIKKLIILIILICSGYSDEDKNTENKFVLSKQYSQTGLSALRDSFKNKFEKPSSTACEEKNDEISDFSEGSTLPVTKKMDHPSMMISTRTGTTGNNIVPEIINNSDFYNRRSHPNIYMPVKSDLTNKEDDDCEETNKKFEKIYSVSEKSNINIDKIPSNMKTENLEKLCNDDLNMNAERGNDGSISYTEGVPRTRRILPGIIRNPTAEELKYNKLILNKAESNQIHSDIEPFKNIPATRRMMHDNINNPANQELKNNWDDDVQSVIDERYGINFNDDKTANTYNKMDINEFLTQKYTPLEDAIESQLMEPTKGKGISNMKDGYVMLLENSRVCYACSTVSDPSCWAPNRETNVKYCQKGHNSCLTKSFKYKDTSFIIRDCGNYCVNPNGDQYSSCSICHSDLCNSASTISLYNTGIFVLVVLFGILFSKS